MCSLSVPAAAAKGPARPVVGTVCGASGCTRAAGFSLRVAGTPTFHRHVAPAPFFVVRLHADPSPYVVGTDAPIVYVSRRAVRRVTIDGMPVWLDVPTIDHRVIRTAAERLRPLPAPRSWAVAARRRRAAPQDDPGHHPRYPVPPCAATT